MLDTWLERVTSPGAIFVALVALVVGATAWAGGDTAGPQMLRFAGVVLAGASFGLTWRLVVAARRRGALPGLFATTPLPFFEEELGARALSGLRGGVAIPALLVATTALGLLGAVAIGVGLEPRHDGVIDLVPGRSVESWTSIGPPVVERGLGFEVEPVSIDTTPPGTLTLDVAPLSTREAVRLAVGGGEDVRVGDLSLRWTSVTAAEEIGGAEVELVPRDGGTPARVRLTIGGTAEIPGVEGGRITLHEASGNRLGALGPGVRLELSCGDESRGIWLHDRAPDLHVDRGTGCVGVRLLELTPAMSARLTVRGAQPTTLFAIGAGLLVLAVAGLLVARSKPVVVRGRSGDYELAVLRLFRRDTGVATERAAEKLLDAARLREWRDLLKRLGAP